jgi:hypothetical protein
MKISNFLEALTLAIPLRLPLVLGHDGLQMNGQFNIMPRMLITPSILRRTPARNLGCEN